MSERQMKTSIKDVEISHKARYFFASSFIKKGDRVLDACCGVGYGTAFMKHLTHAEDIDCFDKSPEACKFAKDYFGIDSWCEPFENMVLTDNYYDVITCFEAIEHVSHPELLMKKLCEALKPGGKLIMSTPNESRMPWSKEKFPEHLRHYTFDEMDSMMRVGGITNIIPYFQDKWSPCIGLGTSGKFMILVGVKA